MLVITTQCFPLKILAGLSPTKHTSSLPPIVANPILVGSSNSSRQESLWWFYFCCGKLAFKLVEIIYSEFYRKIISKKHRNYPTQLIGDYLSSLSILRLIFAHKIWPLAPLYRLTAFVLTTIDNPTVFATTIEPIEINARAAWLRPKFRPQIRPGSNYRLRRIVRL